MHKKNNFIYPVVFVIILLSVYTGIKYNQYTLYCQSMLKLSDSIDVAPWFLSYITDYQEYYYDYPSDKIKFENFIKKIDPYAYEALSKTNYGFRQDSTRKEFMVYVYGYDQKDNKGLHLAKCNDYKSFFSSLFLNVDLLWVGFELKKVEEFIKKPTFYKGDENKEKIFVSTQNLKLLQKELGNKIKFFKSKYYGIPPDELRYHLPTVEMEERKVTVQISYLKNSKDVIITAYQKEGNKIFEEFLANELSAWIRENRFDKKYGASLVLIPLTIWKKEDLLDVQASGV